MEIRLAFCLTGNGLADEMATDSGSNSDSLGALQRVRAEASDTFRMGDSQGAKAVRDADQSQPCRKASSVAHVLCVAIFGFDSGHSESH